MWPSLWRRSWAMVVADEVGVVVVVGEVVKLLVPVVDALLVGVVASQLRNAPFCYACVTLQLRRTRLSITACASQPKLLRTDKRAGTPVVQKNAPSNTVVV